MSRETRLHSILALGGLGSTILRSHLIGEAPGFADASSIKCRRPDSTTSPPSPCSMPATSQAARKSTAAEARGAGAALTMRRPGPRRSRSSNGGLSSRRRLAPNGRAGHDQGRGRASAPFAPSLPRALTRTQTGRANSDHGKWALRRATATVGPSHNLDYPKPAFTPKPRRLNAKSPARAGP